MKTPDSFTPFCSISLAEFEQVNVSWVHNEKFFSEDTLSVRKLTLEIPFMKLWG